MRSYIEAKAMARSLRDSLSARDISLTHGECLEIVARQFGFREWNILAAKIELDAGHGREPPEAAGMTLQPAIPVISVRSARGTMEFYVGFLGFSVDWGGAGGGRRMYAQISRSGVTLHLSERDGVGDSGGSEILIRMTGLEAFHKELTDKHLERAPLSILHTPDDRRELHVTDPFGNKLRFSENNPAGVANP